MRLSIIVPVYNMAAEGKLNYCMDSLVGQTITDYEIIAVNDASTDNSLEILREYEAKYPQKVRVLTYPVNKRQGGAKNLGLSAAKGEWIGFVDSDDWVSNHMFSRLLQKADETGADVVGCDYLRTEKTGLEEGIPVNNNTPEQTGELNEEKYKLLLFKPGSMVIKIYRRQLFEEHKIRFPEKMFYEDNAIGALPLLYAKHFERVDECLYYYYQYAGSTVHTVNMDRCRDRITAAKIYLKECQDRGFYEKFKAEIDYKVFELGYRNTLFSYLQAASIPKYKFVVEMQKFLKEYIPHFRENPYFTKYMDAESQKLIRMHSKNAMTFLLYYKLLYFYRAIRYGKNGKATLER